MAAAGGFDRPILHGLCSFGIAGRVLEAEAAREGAALHAAVARLGGSVRLRGLRGRFTKHVFPGDTLVVEAWVLEGKPAGGAAVSIPFRVWVVREGAEGAAAAFSDDSVVLANGEAQFVTATTDSSPAGASPQPRL